MNQFGKISVIVPVYNVEKYLRQCLDSILSQTYKNLELIAVDDGSTDNSGLILDEYRLKDSRVIVAHQSNQGVSVARNNGLDLATGNYVAFVDADDYIHSEIYEKLITILEDNNADISICTRRRVYQDGTIENFIGGGYLKVFASHEIKMDLFHSQYDWANPFNKVYVRRIIENLRFPVDIRYGEDLYLAADIWRGVNKAVYLDEGLYYYRYNPTSASFTLGKNKLIDRINATEHAFEYVIEECPQNIPFVFDLQFGAYVAAYEQGENKRYFIKEYRKWFVKHFKICKKSMKGWLFYFSPYIFRLMRNRKESKDE